MIWTVRGRLTFQALARHGRRAGTPSLWCMYLDDPAATPLRVAYAVSRSVGMATQRNRLRRRLRALVDDCATQVGMTSGYLLIGATPAAVEHKFGLLRTELTRLLTTVSTAPDRVRSPTP